MFCHLRTANANLVLVTIYLTALISRGKVELAMVTMVRSVLQ